MTEVVDYQLEDELWRSTAADGRPRRRVYQVEAPMVVLGRGSKPEVELDLEACAADGVPLLRRRGGGCSVVLDPGNLIVAVALPVEGIGRNLEHFDQVNRSLIGALSELGVAGVGQDGTSDLVISDRKIGGTCIYRSRGVLLYSASLLVSPRLELIERYLRHPPREPPYRRGRPHLEFVRTLGVEARQLAPELERALDRALAERGLSGELSGTILSPRR